MSGLVATPICCFYDCTGQFVSGLVATPNCWFSHAGAQIKDILQYAIQILNNFTGKQNCPTDKAVMP